MGGRGSNSSGNGGGGGFGGFGSLQSLIQGMQQATKANTGAGKGSGINSFNAGEGSSTPDYTANNNPALMKWQSQNDDQKVANYLAKLGKQATPGQDAEGYTYHQSPFQNMVIDQNLNAPVFATLNSSDFAKYCQQNGLTPFYRGWSGKSSRDRFENATASHTGTGIYGEGYYFGDKATARGYGSVTTVAALSPQARVVDLDVVRKQINAQSARTKAAFNKSGHTNSRFGDNSGEAQMALKMGYNVIRTDWSYVVLTRDAVVIQK
jgi:hypothetical protein